MELSLGTPETEVQCRLQNWNPSQTKPSTSLNMSWHSYKVHLVPSSSVEVHQGRLQVIICASHCAQRSLQQRPQPHSEEDAEAWLPAMSLYAALRRFLSSFFPLFPWQNKQKNLTAESRA